MESNWKPNRNSCNDDWQRSLWDAAQGEGFNLGYQAGVVHALSEILDFYDEQGLDVPKGLRDAVLNLLGSDV